MRDWRRGRRLERLSEIRLQKCYILLIGTLQCWGHYKASILFFQVRVLVTITLSNNVVLKVDHRLFIVCARVRCHLVECQTFQGITTV